MRQKIAILIVALAVVAGSAAVAAADHDGIDVSQDPGENATVTVTDEDNETVENATVDVELIDENDTYDGAGDYETDANGTVELPAPTETVEVNITATYDNETHSTTATLVAETDLDVTVEQDAGMDATVTVTADGDSADNASVNVSVAEENATYDGVGTYETDENGTTTLTAPEETVDVSLTVTHEDASTTVETTLHSAHDIEGENFGDALQQFKLTINESDPNKGLMVASWVTSNNPGDVPDHAGPPMDVHEWLNETGPPAHAGGPHADDDERGPPEHAGGGDTDGGPPAHAGGPHADTDDVEDDSETDDDEDGDS